MKTRISDLSKKTRVHEILYNGIVLPDPWPPRRDGLFYDDFRNGRDIKYFNPMAVPYLENPPEVIPIDVGRQLFVDNFLIQNMCNLTRVYHHASYVSENPVIQPDKPWEHGGRAPRAWVWSDGVWYDPEDSLFKMWYRADTEGSKNYTCYAVSEDGIRWEKPELDVCLDANIVVAHDPHRDSNTVWLDLEEEHPARRYKMFTSRGVRDPNIPGNNTAIDLRFSADGIHWSEVAHTSLSMRDRSTVFYNAFRKTWVYSIKIRPSVPLKDDSRALPCTRSRAYLETRDLTAPWDSRDIVLWVGADNLDFARNAGIDKQTLEGQHLYNLDGVAYESILLGMFAIFHGNGMGKNAHHHMNDTTLGYSRDGFHWHRPDRRAFLGVSQNKLDWTWNNVQSAGGCCLVVGDQLYFYASGRGPAGECRTGLATLRRDGFVSMDAGDSEGVLITRPVIFKGNHLFVNARVPDGELRIDMLHEDQIDWRDKKIQVIAPFTQENCAPVTTDSTCQMVTWKSAEDLSALQGKPVRFRFHLKNGSLYAFWVSPDRSGKSNGYVAAGGPGFSSNRDC